MDIKSEMDSCPGFLARRLAFWFVLAFFACGQETASAQDKPNILFVLTDDVGWGDIRSYNPDSQVSLPTLEELAAQGMLFTDAHTSAAKCAPSRYSAVTGNYQWRGRYNWGQWNYKGGSQILADQLTLGDVMQQAGYNTAFIGKHHLGGDFFLKNSNNFATLSSPDSDVDFSRQFQDGLLATGFDYSFVALRGIQASPYAFFEDDLLFGNSNNLINWAVGNYGDTVIVKEGIGIPDWNTREVGPDLLEKAVDFIDIHHSSNVSSGTSQPFFVYYNTQAVHGPLRPPIAVRGTPILGTTGVSSRTDLLREIDEVLNILQLELASRGLLDNTLIIFTSDNGPLRLNQEINLGHDAVGGFRGAKGMIFEGGHRVPLIVKWGNGTAGGSTVQPGAVSDALIGVQDFYATLASLVGVAGTEDQGHDSFNMLPILLGQSGSLIRDHIIHEADQDENTNTVSRHFAFREGDWKLILDGDDQPSGLYDLANDPQETTDLVDLSSQAARINQMLSRFADLRSADRTAPTSEGSLVQVPNVLGLTQIDAETIIGSAGLGLGTVSMAPSDTVAEGNIISQNPSVDTWVLLGSTVDLVVSSGPSGSENSDPTVTITSPAAGSSFFQGDEVVFSGTADDVEDGDLSGSIVWTSDLEGGEIGSGSGISISTLGTGIHTITATVSDLELATATDSITISVTVAGGGGTTTLPDIADSFTRGATGVEDTNYGLLEFMRVENLGVKSSFVRFDISSLTGAVISATLNLPVGEVLNPGTVSVHAVQEAWSELAITHNNQPSVDVVPVTTFVVVSSDGGTVVQVDITDLVAAWQADPTAAFGIAMKHVGQTHVAFSTRETANGPFVDVILEASGNTAPEVTITSPSNGSVFAQGATIGFVGTATDVEDLTLTPSLDWLSNIDGDIGDGGSISTILSVGYHTVTASVTDSGGQSGSDVIHVVVVDPPGCIADIVTPGNETVSGPDSVSAVNSVTISSNTVLDGSGGTVTLAAGGVVEIDNDVEFRGSVTIVNTPTPCL